MSKRHVTDRQPENPISYFQDASHYKILDWLTWLPVFPAGVIPAWHLVQATAALAPSELQPVWLAGGAALIGLMIAFQLITCERWTLPSQVRPRLVLCGLLIATVNVLLGWADMAAVAWLTAFWLSLGLVRLVLSWRIAGLAGAIGAGLPAAVYAWLWFWGGSAELAGLLVWGLNLPITLLVGFLCYRKGGTEKARYRFRLTIALVIWAAVNAISVLMGLLFGALLAVALTAVPPIERHLARRPAEFWHRLSIRFWAPHLRSSELWWGIASLLVFALAWSGNWPYTRVLGDALMLLALLLAAGPGASLDRLAAGWRWISSPLRIARVRQFAAPAHYPDHLMVRLTIQFRRFYRRYARSAKLAALVVLGGVGMPALAYFIQVYRWAANAPAPAGTPPTALELMAIGVVSAVLFVAGYLSVIAFQRRVKHLVLPFVAVGASAGQLDGAAQLLTQLVAERIRNIGHLLTTRQVENVNARTDDPLAMFVTSGADRDLTEAVRSLAAVETSQFKFPLGGYLTVLLQLIAQTRVAGTVQSPDGKVIEVTLEVARRDGRSESVRATIHPQGALTRIDEATLERAADDLAAKVIMQLGDGRHLTAHWESFQQFLAGLEAGHRRRNWWEASACYRRAIHIEAAAGGKFGLGYYHLGASLVYLGEIEDGLKYLLQAEVNGPPLAENQYMLALTLLIKYWNKLHEEDAIFSDILRRCQLAIALRRPFPEAHHLLGVAHYQYAKLHHRAATKHGGQGAPTRPGAPVLHRADYARHYHRAAASFRRSLSQYEAAMRTPSRMFASPEFAQPEAQRLLQEWATVSHQLGDALRGARRFCEAEMCYRDVLGVFPSNLRTLVDLAQVYCLTEQWQTAQSFLRREAYVYDEAAWSPDTSFFMACALLGGISAETNAPHSQRLVSALVPPGRRRQPTRDVPSSQQKPSAPSAEGESADITVPAARLIFLRAMAGLDYALHHRPRFISNWEDTPWRRWLDEASQAICRSPMPSDLARVLSSTSESPTDHGQPPAKSDTNARQHHVYTSQLEERGSDLVLQALYWLCWRIHSLNPNEGSFNSSESVPNPKLEAVYAGLCSARRDLGEFLRANDQERRFRRLGLIGRHLRYASQLERYWRETEKVISAFSEDAAAGRPDGSNRVSVNFAERWAVDVFCEVTLLLLRCLAEGQAFEAVEYVAEATISTVEHWIQRRWIQSFGQEAQLARPANLAQLEFAPHRYFRFSPYVIDWQRASLYAWRGFAAIRRVRDFESQARRYALAVRAAAQSRTLVSDPPGRSSRYVEVARESADFALWLVRTHPLALYVDALVKREQSLVRQAIDGVHHLLALLAPLDPQQRLVNVDTRRTRSVTVEADKDRTNYYYIERVAGQFQFDTLVFPANLHMFLAELFLEREEPTLSLEHGFLALASSPYEDLDASNFLLLTQQLIRLDRFAEAGTLVYQARARSLLLSPVARRVALCDTPLVLEAMLNTRLGRYQRSLELSQPLGTFPSNAELAHHLRQLARQLINGILGVLHPRRHFLALEPTVREQIWASGKRQWASKARRRRLAVLWRGVRPISKSRRKMRYARSAMQRSLLLPLTAGPTLEVDRQGAGDDAIEAWALWVEWARSALGPRRLADGLRPMAPRENEAVGFVPEWIAFSLAARFLAREVLDWLVNFSEVQNNRAYNRAELLDVHTGEDADEDGLGQAIYVMEELRRKRKMKVGETEGKVPSSVMAVPRGYSLSVLTSLEAGETETKVPSSVVAVSSDYSLSVLSSLTERLAQYYDTQAYLHYQCQRFDKAEKLLYKAVVPLFSSSPVIEMRLAQVNLRLIERTWQGLSSKAKRSLDGPTAKRISKYLRRCQMHLQHAAQLDTSHRLELDLRSIRQRLDDYRGYWDEYQVLVLRERDQ